MIGRTNVGGGVASSAWAYIAVTYPEGSTCTATNGVITLTAEDTSGMYVFGIPEPAETPEEWTVAITNGVKTKTAEVELSQQYGYVVVTLRYSRLPEGYQEVEYLESDGEQYIDIFGTAENPYAYEFELSYITFNTYGRSICGADNRSFETIFIGRLQTTSSAQYDYYFESAGGRIVGNVSANQRATVIINNDERKVIENDVELGTLTETSGTSRLYLFATSSFNQGGHNGAVGRVYSFSAKNKTSGIIEKNFVPCYRTSDDEAGFYDLANNTFVQNDGYGSFTVGPDV